MDKQPDHLSLAQSRKVERARKARNYAILIVLLGLCALFYGLSLVKLHGH